METLDIYLQSQCREFWTINALGVEIMSYLSLYSSFFTQNKCLRSIYWLELN